MNKKLIYISSVGGSLEFFDFMIFVHLYPVIIDKFFPPSDNNLQKTFLTILTFIISYIAKPFGGIFYGNYPGGSGLTNGSVFGRIAGTQAGAFAKG
jgi:hypothetical protein